MVFEGTAHKGKQKYKEMIGLQTMERTDEAVDVMVGEAAATEQLNENVEAPVDDLAERLTDDTEAQQEPTAPAPRKRSRRQEVPVDDLAKQIGNTGDDAADQGAEEVAQKAPAAPAPKKRAKQVVLPEGYTVEAGAWEQLFQAMKRDYTVAALITAIDYPDGKPAWEIIFRDYPGIRGVVPASETDLPDPRIMQRFVGQPINVRVKGMDRASNLAACSRREAVASARVNLFGQVRAGVELPCIIKAILPRDEEAGKPDRLLVDVGGGVLVEVNRNQAQHKLSQRLNQQYLPGQNVTARVTRIEPNKGIIEVTLRDRDPWINADFKRGQPISGTVVRIDTEKEQMYIEPDGAPGVTGISPLPSSGNIYRGARWTCKVDSFVRDAHRLRLQLIRQSKRQLA
jgi:small subunit ribosomal protein S1